MSQHDKLIQRFCRRPKDFTWDELARLLAGFGYTEESGSGSRRKFRNAEKRRLYQPSRTAPWEYAEVLPIEGRLESLKAGRVFVNDAMEYKGYVGSVYYSDEDEVFHGKLEGIRDLVTYEATDVQGLKKSFREAVDDYLKTCKKRGKTPETPYKGTFNVRVGPDLHRRTAVFAAKRRKKLNAIVAEALEHYLETAR